MKYMFPCRWMVVGAYIFSSLFILLLLLGVCLHLSHPFIPHLWIWGGPKIHSFSCCFYPLLVHVLHLSRVLLSDKGGVLLRSNVPLIHIGHTLKFIHHFLHSLFWYIMFDSFVSFVLQEFMSVLDDIIYHNCLLYPVI